MFLKNKNIIFKIRRSKVTDYAALKVRSLFFIKLFKRIYHLVHSWSMTRKFDAYCIVEQLGSDKPAQVHSFVRACTAGLQKI